LQKGLTDIQGIIEHKVNRVQEVEVPDTVEVLVEVPDTVEVLVEVPDTVEVLVEVPDTVEVPDMVEVLGLAEVQMVTNAQKCTMQFAEIVETNVRYHSNQRIADQFIAENVFKSTNHKNVVIRGLTEMMEALDTAEILVAGLKKIEPQFIAEIVLEKMYINQKM
jgi:hypothetical protein